MEKEKSNINLNTYYTGLVLFIISFVIFHFTEVRGEWMMEGRFLINYGIFIIYFFVVIVDNKRITNKIFKFYNLRHNLMLLLLANVSAYALNREIPVFLESSYWLCIYLVVLNLAILLVSFTRFRLPKLYNYGLMAILSSGIAFNFYEMIYVYEGYPFVCLGFWFFGIPLHLLVPMWFFLALSIIVYRQVKKERDLIFSALGGIFIPIVIMSAMIIRWSNINDQIMTAWNDANAPKAEAELPNWLRVGQKVKYDFITDRILKSGWLYADWDSKFSANRAFMGRNFKQKTHDPFVMIASAIGGDLDLNYDQKILLYNTLTNDRHSTEERLWSGNDLITKNITTNVQLMPAYRIAYTEKTFEIKNTAKANDWRRSRRPNTQEAIYTFNLPEGAIVSSASLWVNGVESKSILTTKKKAEKAYKRIVGVERRDPLLVTWREGNQVSARIFPCSPKEDRIFKLGFTSPLHFEDGQLNYENIDFKGPSWKWANERINIISETEIPKPNSPLWLSPYNGAWTTSGAYQSDWTLSFEAPQLSNEVFSFGNRSFQMEEYKYLEENFEAEAYYLDINQDWSEQEFKQIWKTIKNQKTFVYTNQLIQLTESNKDHLFKQLQRDRFSVFPFYKIGNPEKSLVISKYGASTPILNELGDFSLVHRKKDLQFSTELENYLSKLTQPIRVFNIGQESTAYLNSLKELRSIHMFKGDMDQLIHNIVHKEFKKYIEDDNLVHLDYAKINIKEIDHDAQPSTAPDHLMRLYTYNKLMKTIGSNYYHKMYLEDDLIEEASTAVVLSPISSFVTLETQKDYDRFDIKRNSKALNNASFNSSGSVPEPHEWLLIIVGLSFALFLWFKH